VGRLYHSPSSYSKGLDCQTAFVLEYFEGKRPPRVTWDEIKDNPNHEQRGSALGVAIHAVLEAWQTPGGEPDWTGLPGKVALSATRLIPQPDRVLKRYTEGGIGRAPMPPGADEHAPTTRLSVDGVWWAGYRDLLVSAPAEFKRLGIHAPDGWVLYDYKSTRSIDQWALDPDELLVDVQANVYAVDVCELLGLTRIPGVWVYAETLAKRREETREVMLELSRARDVMGEANIFARQLDALADAWQKGGVQLKDVPRNVESCGKYRGCPHHPSRGGTCPVERGPTLVKLRRKAARTEVEQHQMALPASVLKRQAEAKAAAEAAASGGGGAETATETEAPDGDVPQEGAALGAETPAVAPVTRITPVAKPAAKVTTRAKGSAGFDSAGPFGLEFEGGSLTGDVRTLRKVVPALGAASYILSQGKGLALAGDAVSIGALLEMLAPIG
jgi:hypothetical protein